MKKIHVNKRFTEVATKSVDSRNRVPIGCALRNQDASRFRIYLSPKGDILLRPMVEIPLSQLLNSI